MMAKTQSAFVCVVVSVLLVAMTAGPVLAEDLVDPRIGEPVPLGEEESVYVVLDSSPSGSLQHAIHYPQASFIKVHFLETDLAQGDRITVESLDGKYSYIYPGSSFTTDGGEGFWALTVFGHTAVVSLHRAGPTGAESRVVIDRFIRGYAEWEMPGAVGTDSTCGNLDRADVACWQATHPTEFNTAHAVALHVKNGAGNCTSWRVGTGPHMMSNEHCITSQAELDVSEFWFNYQRPDCGSGSPGPVTVVAGDTFLIDDYGLDFALFTIENPASVSSFGHLELDPRTPVLNEEIYIPQHGGAQPKQFGIDSDVDPGGVCQIQDEIRDGRQPGSDTGYYCDTTGGSSGSPVIARSTNRVIGLHHWGTGSSTCTGVGSIMNGGVRIELIYPLIETYLAELFSDDFETGNFGAWSAVQP
jgi:hypothetical protein